MDNEPKETEIYTLAKMYRTLKKENVPLEEIKYRKIGVDGTNLLICMEGCNARRVQQEVNKLKRQGRKGQEVIKRICYEGLPNEVVRTFVKKLMHIIQKFTYSNIGRCFVVFDGRVLKKKSAKKQYSWKQINKQNWQSYLNESKIENWKLYFQDQQFLKGDGDYGFLTDYQKSQQYWAIYNHIVSTIMYILQNARIFVVRAPYEADAQLIKLFREEWIDSVISYDHGFINYEVPLILGAKLDGAVDIIDFSALKPNDIKNPLLRKWVQETQSDKDYIEAENKNRLMKRMALEVLRGSKYIQDFKALALPDIMRAILSCNQIDQTMTSFFKLLKRYNPKYLPDGYRDDAFEVMLIFLYQTCARKSDKKLEYLNQQYDKRLSRNFVAMFEYSLSNESLLREFKRIFNNRQLTQDNAKKDTLGSAQETSISTNNSNNNNNLLLVDIQDDDQQEDIQPDDDIDLAVDLSRYKFQQYIQQVYHNAAQRHLRQLVGEHYGYTMHNYFGRLDTHKNRPRGKEPQLKPLNDPFKQRLQHILQHQNWIQVAGVISLYRYYLNYPNNITPPPRQVPQREMGKKIPDTRKESIMNEQDDFIEKKK